MVLWPRPSGDGRKSKLGTLSLIICREKHSPALTVIASINCSLQLFVPTTRARFVFLISLSTVL